LSRPRLSAFSKVDFAFLAPARKNVERLGQRPKIYS
jgi:hypothetical protein